ncbi:MAG: MmgE/PrpD family protein, partial [Gammaproteobacteria bacterium]|nr:MmgE/PrpD family protein [Gammaproteobacteria bacterium]
TILSEGFLPLASLVAGEEKVSLSQAAMINGSAAHAHDYDDVHMSMSGHPTVPVAPAVLALAEQLGSNPREVVLAFVTGLDTECLIGRYVGASHYARGFHATATLGTFGAAAACASLLGLDTGQCRHALGLAATQAAGLKSMFGTMCKPFHAGKAAANGLLAAQLAARGFTSQLHGLEVFQGFGPTHSDTLSEEKLLKALAEGQHVPKTLFKYHAACYLTHSAMEGLRFLVTRHDIAPSDVDKILLKVDQGHFSVCNIQEPATGLEAKFSLRFTAAMILHGLNTASISDFSDTIVADAALVSTRDRVEVEAFTDTPAAQSGYSRVRVLLKDGRVFEKDWNVAVPEKNLDAQAIKLQEKFMSLSRPVLGEEKSNQIVALLDQIEDQKSMAELWSAIRM